MTKETRYFVFWGNCNLSGYHVLGSELEEILPDGRVTTKGYQHRTFRPLLIVPLATGKEMLAQVEKLREEEHQAVKAAQEEMEKGIAKILGITVKVLRS